MAEEVDKELIYIVNPEEITETKKRTNKEWEENMVPHYAGMTTGTQIFARSSDTRIAPSTLVKATGMDQKIRAHYECYMRKDPHEGDKWKVPFNQRILWCSTFLIEHTPTAFLQEFIAPETMVVEEGDDKLFYAYNQIHRNQIEIANSSVNRDIWNPIDNPANTIYTAIIDVMGAQIAQYYKLIQNDAANMLDVLTRPPKNFNGEAYFEVKLTMLTRSWLERKEKNETGALYTMPTPPKEHELTLIFQAERVRTYQEGIEEVKRKLKTGPTFNSYIEAVLNDTLLLAHELILEVEEYGENGNQFIWYPNTINRIQMLFRIDNLDERVRDSLVKPNLSKPPLLRFPTSNRMAQREGESNENYEERMTNVPMYKFPRYVDPVLGMEDSAIEQIPPLKNKERTKRAIKRWTKEFEEAWEINQEYNDGEEEAESKEDFKKRYAAEYGIKPARQLQFEYQPKSTDLFWRMDDPGFLLCQMEDEEGKIKLRPSEEIANDEQIVILQWGKPDGYMSPDESSEDEGSNDGNQENSRDESNEDEKPDKALYDSHDYLTSSSTEEDSNSSYSRSSTEEETAEKRQRRR